MIGDLYRLSAGPGLANATVEGRLTYRSQEVLPARELLADMLLDMGRHQEAHEQYLKALERSPNRFNSLYGAGRAAELAGDDTRPAHRAPGRLSFDAGQDS